jgi:hypothetical protein
MIHSDARNHCGLVARCPVSQILCPDGGIPALAKRIPCLRMGQGIGRARKHGLNVPVMHDPDVGADVAFMAEEIDQSRYINTIR